MMTEESWLLPYIWTQEYGFNWDVLFAYAVTLAFAALPVHRIVQATVSFLAAQVNKIKFTVPVINYIVDFNSYSWDDKFFADFGSALENKMLAKQSTARKVKVDFKAAMLAAGSDQAKQKEAIETSYKALEGLTDELVNEMKDCGDAQLWSALETRFGGDTAKAVKWARDKVKALVEKNKSNDPSRVKGLSFVSELLKEVGSELGNESSSSAE